MIEPTEGCEDIVTGTVTVTGKVSVTVGAEEWKSRPGMVEDGLEEVVTSDEVRELDSVVDGGLV